MTVVVRHITIDAKNAYELATFWSFLTGYPIHEDDKPGESEIGIVLPDPEGNEFCVERSDAERAEATALAEGSV